MIIDPFGDIISECRTLGDDFVSAALTARKTYSGGWLPIYQCKKT